LADYLARLQGGAEDGTERSPRDALVVYGGNLAHADNILALARHQA
jgi:hypothetical protein